MTPSDIDRAWRERRFTEVSDHVLTGLNVDELPARLWGVLRTTDFARHFPELYNRLGSLVQQPSRWTDGPELLREVRRLNLGCDLRRDGALLTLAEDLTHTFHDPGIARRFLLNYAAWAELAGVPQVEQVTVVGGLAAR